MPEAVFPDEIGKVCKSSVQEALSTDEIGKFRKSSVPEALFPDEIGKVRKSSTYNCKSHTDRTALCIGGRTQAKRRESVTWAFGVIDSDELKSKELREGKYFLFTLKNI